MSERQAEKIIPPEVLAIFNSNNAAIASIEQRLNSGSVISAEAAKEEIITTLEATLEREEENNQEDRAEAQILLDTIKDYPEEVLLKLEDIGCEGPDRVSLEKSLESQRDEIRQTNFYTDPDYGARADLDNLFRLQTAELDQASPSYKRQVLVQQSQELQRFKQAMESLDDIHPRGVPDHFSDQLVSLWSPGNEAFIQAIQNRSPENIKGAMNKIQSAADTIEAEYQKYRTAMAYLDDPDTQARTVSHLFDTEAEPDSIDAAQLFRMLGRSAHLGIDFNPHIKDFVSDTLLQNYLNRIKNRYQTRLDINTGVVDGTYQNILEESLNQTFQSKTEYDAFIAQNMKDRLGDFYKKKPKLLPDSVWDGQKQQRQNQAERNWETYLDRGESQVWNSLDQALSQAENKTFATKADFIAHLKETTSALSQTKFIPDDVWDTRIKDRFKDRVENSWQKRVERGEKEAHKILDDLFQRAEKMNFASFAELQAYLRLTTAEMDLKKVVPDDHWGPNMRPAFHAREQALWARMQAEKTKDSKAVEVAMKKVSLAPSKITGKPKTEADFFKLGKAQLPQHIKGKLTDADWDNHMEAFFYPHLKAQLQQNEALVANAMRSFPAPSLEDRLKCSNEAAYLSLVKTRFAERNQGIMGAIPNAQYDVLRDRLLISTAREQWRSHERQETLSFREAQAALNTRNLVKTVHHFAKNKKIVNPTMAEIKTSSKHALQAQFGLRPDQLDALDKDLKTYAAQALALYKSRKHTALGVIQKYKVPSKGTFTDKELNNPAAFYDALLAAAGDIKFAHTDDWYLVKAEAMEHIEGLRQAELQKATEAEETLEVEGEQIEATVSEPEATTEEEGSNEELVETPAENLNDHPTEQTAWMKRFGIPVESVSAKGVERFSRIMNLPEFNLGGIPTSDLQVAIPVLVNLLGAFMESTWKNFTLQLREDIRGLESTDPQAKLFQIMKSFAIGYPTRLSDFDGVPGLDNTFNNLIKRLEGPEGETFTTIKNLYLHYYSEAGEETELSEEEMAAALLELEVALDGEDLSPEEDLENENTDDLEVTEVAEGEEENTEEGAEEEGLESELPESKMTEEPLSGETPAEKVLDEGGETEAGANSEILEFQQTNQLAKPEETDEDEALLLDEEVTDETENKEEDDDEAVDQQNAEAEEAEEKELSSKNKEDSDEAAEAENEAGEKGSAKQNSEDKAEDEAETGETVETTETDQAYQDYLKEGAVVLTEVDQILRRPTNPEVTETETNEVLAKAEFVDGEIEEPRIEERKAPLAEAAEVLPKKVYRAILKLSASGLLSAEALNWMIEQSTEFYVADDDVLITLSQVLTLIEISLRSQFLARNLRFRVSLSQTIQGKAVPDYGELIESFIIQARAVDGLQQIVINGYRGNKLRGYFQTRFGNRAFAYDCRLQTVKKVRR